MHRISKEKHPQMPNIYITKLPVEKMKDEPQIFFTKLLKEKETSVAVLENFDK